MVPTKRKFSFALFLMMTCTNVLSKEKNNQFSTSFGRCPTRAVGELTLNLIKEYEKKKSLYDVKSYIKKEKVIQKYYLSDFKIQYIPVENKIKFSFDCPEPVMKVQIYKNDGEEYYTALLVDNGEIYDPAYEMLLKTEKKLKYELPFLAMPIGEFDKGFQKEMATVMKKVPTGFRKYFSEMIVDDKNELTVMMSVDGKPTSAFLGQGNLNEKFVKLTEMISFLKEKNKIPSHINLTNPKKVVVKFSDSI